ncbi:MAG: hypothetical protein GY787_02855, partial [Alteromonadales bacterium]|nr:hypothetical protein [Alteromonadales bacterium]
NIQTGSVIKDLDVTNKSYVDAASVANKSYTDTSLANIPPIYHYYIDNANQAVLKKLYEDDYIIIYVYNNRFLFRNNSASSQNVRMKAVGQRTSEQIAYGGSGAVTTKHYYNIGTSHSTLEANASYSLVGGWNWGVWANSRSVYDIWVNKRYYTIIGCLFGYELFGSITVSNKQIYNG